MILLVAPILSLYFRTLNNANSEFQWSEVFHEWKFMMVFCLVFTIHNFLIAPLLVYLKRPTTYAVISAALLIAFSVWQYTCRPKPDNIGAPPHTEQALEESTPPPLPDDVSGEPCGPDGKRELPPPKPSEDPNHKSPEPPVFSGEHDIVSVLMMAGLLGINLLSKYYFRFADERKRLEEIEKQSLENQLKYLKYQINPHFFMNTLNNIHALVDIDPERAKTTILELSKLMRFVLYEGNKTKVPLQREIDFVSNYIRLMRLRYAEEVEITMEVNGPVPEMEIIPMIFITFVENSFKHGISYKHKSFVDVAFSFSNDTITFVCRNSKTEASYDSHGGVGLTNVRQRLALVYGDSYTLTIKDENDTYNVKLIIPIKA